jgi:hypothetical protein
MPSISSCRAALSALLIATSFCAAQNTLVEFPDNLLSTGATNTQPFNSGTTTTGFTSFMVYPGISTPNFPTSLQSSGVQPGSFLTEIAVVPVASGTYTSGPNLQIHVGHLLNPVTSPSGWLSNLDNPVLIYDAATHGVLSFPYTLNTYAPILSMAANSFAWDGVRDVGVMISCGPGATSGMSMRTAGFPTGIGYVRHGTTSYAPAPGTAQTTTGILGMRMRMTFAPGFELIASTGGGGLGDLSMSLALIPAGTALGFNFITADTTGPLGQGPFFGLVPDATTWFILQQPAAPGNPLNWVPGYGFFPDVPFTVPPGVLSFLAGQSWRLCNVAFDANFTYLGRTNVVQLNW